MKQLFLLLTLWFSNLLIAQQKTYVPDSSERIRQRLEEWQDLKFGLLMHWGTYSQWGIVESWSICPEDLSWATGGRKKGISDTYAGYVKAYEDLQKTFNPTQFAPDKWAEAAKGAGMKYMIFTTKHHDGFCMFDSRFTDYKITDSLTPFSSNPRSNIAKEVFSAFRKEDFWIGAYFSKPDWHCENYWWKNFPAVDRNCNYSIKKYPEEWEKFIRFTHGQINELVSDYGKIDILWLDGGWVRSTSEEEVKNYLLEEYEGSRYSRNPQNQDIRMGELVNNARTKQPDLIVVDRAVSGPYQNYLTPEQHIPETGLPYPWETCMTMATSWSYVPNDTYKPTNELIEKLVDIVSKGGNLLLNIGPGPDGTLDSVAYSRLEEMGEWMKVNSEAIYATRMYEVFGEGENVRYTRSKDQKTIYVFLFDITSESLTLEQLPLAKSAKITQLGTGKSLSFKSSGGKTIIKIPAYLKKNGEHVWVLKVSL